MARTFKKDESSMEFQDIQRRVDELGELYYETITLAATTFHANYTSVAPIVAREIVALVNIHKSEGRRLTDKEKARLKALDGIRKRLDEYQQFHNKMVDTGEGLKSHQKFHKWHVFGDELLTAMETLCPTFNREEVFRICAIRDSAPNQERQTLLSSDLSLLRAFTFLSSNLSDEPMAFRLGLQTLVERGVAGIEQILAQLSASVKEDEVNDQVIVGLFEYLKPFLRGRDLKRFMAGILIYSKTISPDRFGFDGEVDIVTLPKREVDRINKGYLAGRIRRYSGKKIGDKENNTRGVLSPKKGDKTSHKLPLGAIGREIRQKREKTEAEIRRQKEG